MTENDIEQALIHKLGDLKYTLRPDIRDRAALEKNFRQKIEELNRVTLTEGEFQRLQDELITSDVYAAARVLRERNSFTGSLVRRMLSDDYADKVIVCTIQKLGLALDESSKRNQENKRDGKPTFKQLLEPLANRRIVFIFDECHRSQFGDNHKAIKEFFPNSQLFGFTGTPIFNKNSSYQRIEGDQASLRTTEDLFQQELHAYTITHAIEDQNVLRFHVDYYKPDGKDAPKAGQSLTKRAVVDAILAKHDAATGGRRFNALLATSSINDAIEYFEVFKTVSTPSRRAMYSSFMRR